MNDRKTYEIICQIMNWTLFDKYNNKEFVELKKTKPPLNDRLELTKDMKKELRRKNKMTELSDKNKPTNTIYREDYNDIIRKYVYDRVFDDEDIREYHEDYEVHNCTPYDCSGIWITSWISIFPLPMANKTIVYHCKTLDV